MATTKEYLNFILEQLSLIKGITYKMMMGEYIIYNNEKIAAYLCDNRLLVKPVAAAKKLMPNASYEQPYPGAKDMLLVNNVDDKNFLKQLFDTMYPELSKKVKK